MAPPVQRPSIKSASVGSSFYWLQLRSGAPLGAPGGTCSCPPGPAANTALQQSRGCVGGGSLSVTFYGGPGFSGVIISSTQPDNCSATLSLSDGEAMSAGVKMAMCCLYLTDLSAIFARAGRERCRLTPCELRAIFSRPFCDVFS